MDARLCRFQSPHQRQRPPSHLFPLCSVKHRVSVLSWAVPPCRKCYIPSLCRFVCLSLSIFPSFPNYTHLHFIHSFTTFIHGLILATTTPFSILFRIALLIHYQLLHSHFPQAPYVDTTTSRSHSFLHSFAPAHFTYMCSATSEQIEASIG
ncbi:hypothetical protein GGS26DRAFT_98117 [Hypomontagnella submonticulosa]|nr:hypothetical protein GGS26DRAFT_98117 [Hypomontagnella submonticulosa]